MIKKSFEKKSNTVPIRVKPSVRDEIKQLKRRYVKDIIEKGEEGKKIEQLIDKGISSGEFIEVLVEHFKSCKQL